MSEVKKYITKCRICGQEFRSNSLKIPIIGEAPNDHFVKLFRTLYEHLAGKHMFNPELTEKIAFAILCSIESEDPAIKEQQAKARHDMHRYTLDPKWGGQPFPDDVLKDAIAACGIDGKQAEYVLVLCGEIRDALLEQGKFAPGQPIDAPAVEAPAR